MIQKHSLEFKNQTGNSHLDFSVNMAIPATKYASTYFLEQITTCAMKCL